MQEARRRPTRRNPRWVHAAGRAARLSPRTSGLGREMPMLLERTLVYIYVVLFAISILFGQPVPLAIAS